MEKKIIVRLFAGLGQVFTIPDTLDLTASHTVREIVEAAGIPLEKVTIMFINGRHAKMTDVVHPGEALALFPPIGGG